MSPFLTEIDRRNLFRALLLACFFFVVFQQSGVTDALQRAWVDLHHRLYRQEVSPSFPPELLLVTVDDRTPTGPTRQQFADILNHLSAARVVAFDYILEEASGDVQGDTALATALQKHGNVILPTHQYNTFRPVNTATQTEATALAQRFPSAAISVDPEQWNTQRTLTTQPPYAPFARHARTLSFVEVNADRDNVYRTPVLVRLLIPEGRVLPHLSVAVAAAARQVSLETALRDAPFALNLGKSHVPLQEQGSYLYRPIRSQNETKTTAHNRLPILSFSDVLSQPKDFFAGKIVLIGETRTGTTDIRATPLNNGLSGVELNAEILVSLLSDQHLTHAPTSTNLALLLAAFLFPILLFTFLPPRRAIPAVLLLLFALLVMQESQFWFTNQIPNAAPVLMAWLGATLFAGQQRASEEAHRRERLRAQFAEYVAPEAVAVLMRADTDFVEKPRRQYMAVLFSDLRDFTPYTESTPPDIVQRQLSEYLGEMTEAVFEQNGFLDKFIGDAVMVLFGPLHPTENPSADAILCALAMQKRLDRLNQRWRTENLPSFRVGIGIHVGEATFGNLSSGRRKTLTAIGDVVNLAARLEQATKDVPANILVSEAVKLEAELLLHDRIRFEDRGIITVKGRSEPTQVYATFFHEEFSSEVNP